MFQSAELGHKLSKEDFKKEEERLRPLLIEQQRLLKEKAIPVIVVVGGVDGAGKGEVVNHLMEWFDPRGIDVHALEAPTQEEAERPENWRFWRTLPPKGRIGVYLGSWYTRPILDRVHGESKPAAYERDLNEIVDFERLLVDEGVLVVKFWMHLSKKAQRARLEALEKDKDTRWKVTKKDWEHFELYNEFYRQSAYALQKTSIGDALWHVVEGRDPRYFKIEVTRILQEAIAGRLAHEEKKKKEKDRPALPSANPRTILDTLDLTKALDKDEYEEETEKWTERLEKAARKAHLKQKSLVVAFEGCDAAGKGGAIRRLAQAMHASFYRIIPIAAPNEEERRYPYLWRFWRDLPRAGHMTIFDRTWYGRVLVERVEGYCSRHDWERAYREIVDFERQIVDRGFGLVKCWLQISQDEQLRRFKEREEIEYKRFKIGPDDYRNREKWDAYEEAVAEMVDRTGTTIAPWTLVEAENKYYSRVKILRTVCEKLEELVD